eukprot:1166910-Amphidinium_carterae.1
MESCARAQEQSIARETSEGGCRQRAPGNAQDYPWERPDSLECSRSSIRKIVSRIRSSFLSQ